MDSPANKSIVEDLKSLDITHLVKTHHHYINLCRLYHPVRFCYFLHKDIVFLAGDLSTYFFLFLIVFTYFYYSVNGTIGVTEVF